MHAALLNDWEQVVGLLPADLEESAGETGVFQRARGVGDATTLLRLLLAYACTPMSFRQTVAWAEAQEIAWLTDVSLIERMQNCKTWLLHLISEVLGQAPTGLSHLPTVFLVDATTVTWPSQDLWRLHLCYNSTTQRMAQLRVSDVDTGEGHGWIQPCANSLHIADRAYGSLSQIRAFTDQNGLLLCRLKAGPYLQYANRKGVVTLNIPEGRVMIAPIPDDKLEKVGKRLTRTAQRKQHRQTVEVNQYQCLFCNDPRLSAEDCVAVYRWRWQIELVFKRLKSFQGLDEMSAKQPKLCEVYLLCDVLVRLLAEGICQQLRAYFPREAVVAAITLAALAVPVPLTATSTQSVAA
jgi:hypothetical protein